MTKRDGRGLARAGVLVLGLGVALTSPLGAATLRDETIADWDGYVSATEERIDRELATGSPFLALDHAADPAAATCRAQLASGAICVVERATRDAKGERREIRDGLIHHWVGQVLIRGVQIDDVLAFLQDVASHPRYFEEVEAAAVLERDGDRMTTSLRLRRKKIVTVRYDTTHEVRYRRHDPNHASSRSRSRTIAELDDAGSADEHAKPIGDDRGYLWRLNADWRLEQTPQGVIVECESLSLSRSVPWAARWLVSSYIRSVPKESMERTLAAIRQGSNDRRAESERTRHDSPPEEAAAPHRPAALPHLPSPANNL